MQVLDAVDGVAENVAGGVLAGGGIGLHARESPLNGKTFNREVAEEVDVFGDRNVLLGSIDDDASGHVGEAVDESVGPAVFHGNRGADRDPTVEPGDRGRPRPVGIERLPLHRQITADGEPRGGKERGIGHRLDHAHGRRVGQPLDRLR